jgi:GT2 family glycosyltransferase
MTDMAQNPNFEKISVVTPTFRRPKEIVELLQNLSQQTFMAYQLIIVDGSPIEEKRTQEVVDAMASSLPFQCQYIRHGGGTAIQRNVGIEAAKGDFIAFIDDDIRLQRDFFEEMLKAFSEDITGNVGGIIGYITNQYFDINTSSRWGWYKRLKLFATYEPGRYDFQTGYPINRYMQPPHDGLREVDFMSTNCAVWRREVLEQGLRFSEFFVGYGVLEDTHFSLRAGRRWKLLENGCARCVHLKTQDGRESSRMVARKTAINYRYVFVDIVPNRTWTQECRFWRVQFFDLFRYIVYAFRAAKKDDWFAVLGKLEGIIAAWRIRPTP